MTVVRSLVLGLAGLVWGMTVSVPGLVELDSDTEGALRTELQLSPFALLLMVVVFTAMVWLIGRATHRRV